MLFAVAELLVKTQCRPTCHLWTIGCHPFYPMLFSRCCEVIHIGLRARAPVCIWRMYKNTWPSTSVNEPCTRSALSDTTTWHPDYPRCMYVCMSLFQAKLRIGKWQVSTSQGAETPEPILMKLRDPTPHDNFGGVAQRGWSGQICDLTHSFFFLI